MFAVVSNLDSTYEGVPIAFGTLYDPFSTGREIVHDDGRLKVQFGEIDDV